MLKQLTNLNKRKSNLYLNILYKRYISNNKNYKTLIDLDICFQIIVL